MPVSYLDLIGSHATPPVFSGAAAGAWAQPGSGGREGFPTGLGRQLVAAAAQAHAQGRQGATCRRYSRRLSVALLSPDPAGPGSTAPRRSLWGLRMDRHARFLEV